MPRHATFVRNDQQEDIDILARTIYGEARGEPVRCKEAVAAVILNRVRRARHTKRSDGWSDPLPRSGYRAAMGTRT